MYISKNSVKCEYVNISFLKNKTVYFPIFQRGYAWKKEQLTELLKEIKRSYVEFDEKKEIYLLDFISYIDDDKFKLADGQQRLITINLILKCINDLIDEEGLEISKCKLYSIIYEDEYNQQKYIKMMEIFPCTPFKKVYTEIYNFLCDNIINLNKIINVLDTKIYIFLKQASSVDDAFDIFQQINTGGKPLNKSEVIKTILTQYSKKYNIPLPADASLKDLKSLIISYDKFVRCDSRSNMDNIGVMTFLNNEIINSENSFKKFINYIDMTIKIKDIDIYKVVEYLNRSQIKTILQILKIKNINIEKDKTYIKSIIFPLCLISIVMTIKGTNPGGTILNLYSDVITLLKNDSKVEKIEDEIIKFVNDNNEYKISLTDFQEGLGSTKLSFNCKKAILLMDIILSNESGSVNVDKINLEHIFPQRPDREWYNKGWSTNHETNAKICNSIGNYILLSETINKTISNKYITVKIEKYKIAIEKDRLLQTNINTVDFDRLITEKEKYINERKNSIAKIIKESFPLGEVIIY